MFSTVLTSTLLLVQLFILLASLSLRPSSCPLFNSSGIRKAPRPHNNCGLGITETFTTPRNTCASFAKASTCSASATVTRSPLMSLPSNSFAERKRSRKRSAKHLFTRISSKTFKEPSFRSAMASTLPKLAEHPSAASCSSTALARRWTSFAGRKSGAFFSLPSLLGCHSC